MIERAARAKINLYLHVLGRREDGFHDLDTVFQEIDLADHLAYEPDAPFGLTVTGADVGAPADNLVWRAATAYFDMLGKEPTGRFDLRKNIPAGAGLGGGSSDAAAALLLLQAWWKPGLAQEDLARLALTLGSDVPFFLVGGCQRGLGRGELLERIPTPEGPRGGFLLLPGLHLPTPAVFRAYAQGARTEGRNHLVAAACAVSPTFAEIWSIFQTTFPPSELIMSGSGSTCVWLTDDQPTPQMIRVCAQHAVSMVPFGFAEPSGEAI